MWLSALTGRVKITLKTAPIVRGASAVTGKFSHGTTARVVDSVITMRIAQVTLLI